MSRTRRLDRVLQITAVVAVGSGFLWLLFSGLMGRTGLHACRWLRLLPPAPSPAGRNPALEDIAADLRRLRHELERSVPGQAAAKRRGTLLAYEDRLVGACRALDVPQSLTEMPAGLPRDAERLRVEACIEDAGIGPAQRAS